MPPELARTPEGVITDTWQQVQMQFVIPAGIVSAEIRVGVMKDEPRPGHVVFDDILLRQAGYGRSWS